MKSKSKRPITRKFWSMLKYLPAPIRKEFVRSKFEINTNLPKDIVFKQAETEEEIFQALNLVYESFLELNYIDPNSSKMRFNKFLALPNTVILIAKQNETVLGTISIIPDSPFGLPSEVTWPVSKYRKSGKLIAEISSLAIRKNFKMRRGKLLFHLCKIMYQYSKSILSLDGIVIATTLEVEPFYTDILMFDKVVETTGQQHSLVKGNPSSCCYLDFSNAESNYKRVYGKKDDAKNLYKFFILNQDHQIILPSKKLSIQGYTKEKNLAQREIFKKYQDLHCHLTPHEKHILSHTDQYKLFSDALNADAFRIPLNKISIRSDVRSTGWIFASHLNEPLRCKVIDISTEGFKLMSESNLSSLPLLSKISVAVQIDNSTILCRSEVLWINDSTTLGAKILNPTQDWINTIEKIEDEAKHYSKSDHPEKTKQAS